MAYSYSCLHSLCSLVFVIDAQKVNKLSLFAFDILVNIGASLDVTGTRRKFVNEVWLQDCFDAENKELLRLQISPHISISNSQLYCHCVAMLFPFCFKCLVSKERELCIRGLKLLAKLVSVVENISYLNTCPEEYWDNVIELLYVSVTSVESMQVTSPSMFSGDGETAIRYCESNALSRIPPCMATFVDICDLELRDLALDVILGACASTSLALKEIVGGRPRLFKILSRICCERSKNDSTVKAGQILQALAVAPALQLHFLSIQNEFCRVALHDEHVSGVYD